MSAYCRGDDLVAEYRATEDWPIRLDVTWRMVPPGGAGRILAGIDLILSVRTELLDSLPALAVQSTLQAAEVLHLDGRAAETWEAEALAERDALPCPSLLGACHPPIEPSGACLPECLVFRLPGVDASYTEMLYPADFQRSVLLSRKTGNPAFDFRHTLFADRLEKGVILRAWIRGLFVPLAGDVEAAKVCHRLFFSAGPPLDA